MKGSLTEPPIIVRESWLSWGGSLFLGMVCVGASLFLPFAGDGASPALGWFGAIAGGAFTAWRYFCPARIEIWPDRFAWTGILPIRREYAFADIEEFAAQYKGRGGWVVGFRLTADSPRRTKLDAVAEVVTGFDETIGGSWEISYDQLVDLLNRTMLLPSAWRS